MKSPFKIHKNSFNENNLNSFKDFIDFSSCPIVFGDNNGGFLYLNLAFAKMLGYLSKTDVEQLNLKENIVANQEEWDSFIFKLTKKGKLKNYPISLITKDNNKISALIDVRVVNDKSGKMEYFEGVFSKNSEDKKNYEELLKELEELKAKEKVAESQVNKAIYTKNVKSQYLANMTHEIKTPINSIVGFLTLIEQNLFESEEELQDFAHNARVSADSLLEIINNILDISKLEAGRMELNEAEFNIRKEVEKAKSITIPAGGKTNLKVSTVISDDIPERLIGDAVRYRQVLINILSNSFKYTESGSIEIRLDVEKKGELTCIIKTTVKDTGIGIPKEKLQLLFKPYTQVKQKKWNQKDGSGLGLMISKELVKLMNGEIVLRSKEKVGTIVEFTTTMKLIDAELSSKAVEEFHKKEESEITRVIERETKPEVKTNEEETKPEEQISETEQEEIINSSDFTEEEPSDVKRILLVEDNPISQKVELRLLKENGYYVDAVSNGYDAIEAVKTNRYSLVLMDVEMPEMNGLEATKKIRALSPPASKVPIIAVTAHSSMKDREKCLAAGLDDYIAKPININFMKITIDHWLLKAVEI